MVKTAQPAGNYNGIKLSFVPPQPQVEVLSEEEAEEEDEEEDILSLAEEKYRPAALEKMIALIALLVEQSRSERFDYLSQIRWSEY